MLLTSSDAPVYSTTSSLVDYTDENLVMIQIRPK